MKPRRLASPIKSRAASWFLCGKSAFTLLEMLVATAVFSLMIVMLLQLTSGLMSNANRVDENLQIDQEVRILFDLMRRDLAQARIGTNQNQFFGTATNVCFVSSSSHLKTNYVSDQRLVTYFYANNTIYRAVVDPTLTNYPTVWNPIQQSWWTQPGFVTSTRARQPRASSRQATRSGRDAVNTNDRKQMKYDIELNIPPPFNP